MDQVEVEAPRIEMLPPIMVDKIAAGEVIEGPFSIIKELVENSLDAGAGRIRIATEQAGLSKIVVEDDGIGIHPDDLKNALTRHATSKIRRFEDLEQIHSFGFRGEALAAIAAVTVTEIRSRRVGVEIGQRIECRGGNLMASSPISCNPGTVIAVSDLFYATPARRKYLKSERSENLRNWRQVSRLALAHPRLHLSYLRDGKEFLRLSAVEKTEDRIGHIFGREIGNHLIKVDIERPELHLWGYITDPHYYRSGREMQFQYVNGRFVEIRNFSYFVRKAYDELLEIGHHPGYFLFLELDPQRVDVNVHPQKKEVRIMGDILLHDLLSKQLRSILRPRQPISISSFRTGPVASALSAPPASPAPLKRFNHILMPVEEALLHAPIEEVASHNIKSFQQGQAGEISRDRIAPKYSQKEAGLARGYEEEQPQQDGQQQDEPQQDGQQQEEQQWSGKAEAFRLERHFGVIFGTYILAEGKGGLYIIDQHTAHERINYEKMLARLSSQSSQRQALLDPLVVEALPEELDALLAKSDELLSNGFLAECIGETAYVIREIPSYIEAGSEKKILQFLIGRILEGEREISLYQEYAAMKACKASVKKNDHLPAQVISDILRELPSCKEPSRCPHGRPTMIRISPEEMDRLFQRGRPA